jgi:hypothetical protein
VYNRYIINAIVYFEMKFIIRGDEID